VVVRNAAVALAFFDRLEGVSELLAGLRDADEYRRWEAVFSLRNLDNPEITEALQLLLDEATEPAERVRREAALALGRIGSEEVASTLLNALQNDTDPGVRWRAALSLSRFKDVSLISQLEQALVAEQDPEVREYINEAIVKIDKS
jgi:HEAT repeat protein